MPTIFDSVVRKENDHTNLLRNVMEMHPQVAASILTYLIEENVSESDAASYSFRTQCSFQGLDGRGIPDLVVEGRNFRCLIEAKIDPRLDLTPAQMSGYRECFESTGERHLCFLVPDGWQHSKSVDQVKASLQNPEINVRKCYWRKLVETITEQVKSLGDPILIEVINFWKWRFESESMSDKEKEILDAWSGEQYTAFQKLHKTIDKARDLFDDSHDYETEFETTIWSYGFYLKRNRKYLLFIGIWTPIGVPLSYSFHVTKPDWLRPDPIPVSPTPISKLEHYAWPLCREAWDNPEKIYADVISFIDVQNYK